MIFAPAGSASVPPSADDRNKRRIFLVEDHPVTRQGLKSLIDAERDLVVCGEADSFDAALEGIQKSLPDVALVDVTLPRLSGLELLKEIKSRHPAVPVLMMSMHDETLFAERALRAGAGGYIMKLETPATILAGIRRLIAGELCLSEKMRGKMLHRIASSSRTEIVYSIETLSDREMEVFQLIGGGYSTRQIAEKLGLSVKTIDSYREHLKLKLQFERGADLVRHAIQWMRTEAVA
jgi:DNA-binding NarL/FixJ family response regulator